MTSAVTLRLDTAIRQRINRVARARRKSVSQVMREAIEAGLPKQETPFNFYESVKDLIGVIHTGDPKGSEDMGRKFTELLKNRRSSHDSRRRRAA